MSRSLATSIRRAGLALILVGSLAGAAHMGAQSGFAQARPAGPPPPKPFGTVVAGPTGTAHSAVAGPTPVRHVQLQAPNSGAPVAPNLQLTVDATEGQSLTVSASFTDAVCGTSYTSTFTWGDTTSGPGTMSGLTCTNGRETGTATASHTYAEDGQYTLSISVSNGSGGTITGSFTVFVAEADLSATGIGTVTVTEGLSGSGVVATFSDTGSPDAAAAFTATVNWGDGTTTAGVVNGSAGSYSVAGTHTYADEGTNTLTVTIVETGVVGASIVATSTVQVSEGDVLAAAAFGPLTANPSFNGQVASFTHTGYPTNPATDFSASINWGDGTTTTGTVGGGAPLTVTGNHTYATEATFTITTTISDDAPGTATAMATTSIHVTGAVETDLVITPASVPSQVEGTASGTLTWFTFTDADDAANDIAASFSASINWGDTTTSAATVTGSAGGPYSVQAAHTYADEGSYTVTVSVQESPDSTSAAVTQTLTVVVNEGDSLAAAAFGPLTANPSFSGQVASFTHTGYVANPATDFTASINWGDGTTTTGTVGGGAPLTVSGSHTYAVEGTFTITTTITDDSPGTATATATTSVNVTNAAETDLVVTAGTPSVAENSSSIITLATFTDADDAANDTAASFSALINWGDNTSSAGTISGGPTYTVTGTHAYADEGSYTVTLSVSEAGTTSPPVTSTLTLTATEADTLTPNSQNLAVTEGATFNGQVATFTNTGYAANLATDFSASINWGDGTPSTTGTVGGGSGSPLTVTGSHAYVEAGVYTVAVTITDDTPGTATAIANSTMTVAEAVLTVTPVSFSPVQGVPFSGIVANLTDANTLSLASDFTATIDWGDGSSSAGTVACGNSSFTISGSHTYTTVGPMTVVVTVSDPDTVAETASGTEVVTVTASADLAVTKQGPAAGQAGGNITYTLTVTNNGPSAAQTVALNDTLPAGTTFVSESQMSGPAFVCVNPAVGSGGTVSCTIASLANGASAVFHVVVKVSSNAASGTTITNTATVSGASSDPNPNNNSSTATTTISVAADLAVTKQAPATVQSGQNITYTFTITNNGPSDAQSVTLNDAIPTGTTFVSQQQTAGPHFGCNVNLHTRTPNMRCTISTLASGASATFQLVVTVHATAGQTVTNTASASSNTTDPIPANNTSTVTTTVT